MLIGVAVVAIPLLATGCGSSAGTTTAATTRAAAGGCASSVYRCTRLTLTNGTPEALTVVAHGRDQGEQRLALAPGATGQFTGYTSTGGAHDLLGRVWVTSKADTWAAAPESARVAFTARNPQVGRPLLGFDVIRPGLETSAVWMSQPAAGASPVVHTYDVGWAVVRAQRNADTPHFIEFEARISPK